jgi:hypothetical protein
VVAGLVDVAAALDEVQT